MANMQHLSSNMKVFSRGKVRKNWKYVVGINLWSDLSGGSCPKWFLLIDTYIPVTVMTADEPAAPTDFKISMVYHKNYRRDSGKGDDVW